MSLTFYTNPQSRGRIVRWMLEEVRFDYDTVVLSYADSMKAPDYLRINPMGKVPAIVHDGKVVTECAAICAYLADAFPQAGLAPATSDRADYYRWLFFMAGPFEQAAIDTARKIEVSDEQSRMVGYGKLDHVVDTLAGHLKDRAFVAGDKFTAADVYVGSHLLWAKQFGWLPERAEFGPYMERLAGRDAYARGNEKDNALIAAAETAEA